MKKVLTSVLLFFCLISCFSTPMGNASLSILWNPQNTSFARMGFSSDDLSLNQFDAADFNGLSTIDLNLTRREGGNIIAYNEEPVYAFFQVYGNQILNVFLEIESASGLEHVPASVSWTDTGTYHEVSVGGTDSSTSRGRIFSYDTTEGAFDASLLLSLEAILPENQENAMSYSGSLKLIMEPLE